ncbi:TIGR02206 family membrane protein [uncultured Lacinutrix sp.]|uniref:YwaF family protein n=1 Tax=uncultured Lacinutrix sp. TaxID=574032 RepID=UPI002605B033|nr:TIGR02206 family membrane protein [uncultured Lacinutrix sp.]
MIALLYKIKPVSIGSLEHIIPIVLAFILGSLLIRFSKKRLNTKHQELLFHALGIFVSLTVFLYHLNLIIKGNYSLITDLPLFLCSFIALFIFVFTHYKKYWMYEILLFWIIAGTSQGVITPDIPEGFPVLDYFRYWIVHLGLLIIIFYATFVFKMQPTIKSLFKSFLAIHIYMLIVFGINYLLGSNYSYLNSKPLSASVLDYLGDWPNYIFVVEAFLIPYFLIIYLPFYISRKLQLK